jgi:hypothetical protein
MIFDILDGSKIIATIVAPDFEAAQYIARTMGLDHCEAELTLMAPDGESEPIISFDRSRPTC